MNTHRSMKCLLVSILFLLAGNILYFGYISKMKEKDRVPSTLRISELVLAGDTLSRPQAALFLCDEEGQMYNGCNCSQNVPILDQGGQYEPIERQDLNPGHAGVVYAYAPYSAAARVDSVPWSLYDYEPLLVGSPMSVTSHIPDVRLFLTPLLGRIIVLLDGEPCREMALTASIPSEGSFNLQTGQVRVLQESRHLHCQEPTQLLYPGIYKDMRIAIGGQRFVVTLQVESGRTTWVYCKSGSSHVRTAIRTW